jgi:hypothetical protein
VLQHNISPWWLFAVRDLRAPVRRRGAERVQDVQPQEGGHEAGLPHRALAAPGWALDGAPVGALGRRAGRCGAGRRVERQ